MLRTITASAVRVVKPVQVSAISCRAYSDGAFKQKEKAAEEQYIRAKEAEEIKKLKEKLAQAEREVAELKKTKK